MVNGTLARWAFAAAAAALCGCGSAGSGYVPARGQVLAGSLPAAGARVTLVPADGKDEPAARPSGVVAEDGTFALATYDPAARKTHPGAPPGKYVALVTWFPKAGPGEIDPNAPQVDRLGGRYAKPGAASFRVEVGEAATDLPPIRVTEVKGRSGG